MSDKRKTKADLILELDALRAELAGLRDEAQASESREEFLDRTLAASLCGIYVYNAVEGHNEYVNRQYTEITGWTLDEINAMPGAEFAELFHPEDRETVFAHMQEVMQARDGQAVEIEYRFRTKDGRWIWCLSRDAAFDRAADGSVRRFIGTFLDISDRKRREEEKHEMEEKLQQAQRLESLGVLAGGIAHDFNNILMSVLGHADLALDELPSLSPQREDILAIKSGAQRAADLCSQLLAYAGRGQFEKRDISLEELIEDMLHMLKTCIAKKCLLNLHLAPKLPPMHGDPSQVRQILMNLLMNASEAIGDRSGVISISTGAMECAEDYLHDSFYVDRLKKGYYVYLEVSDTGCGMDHETKQRIFEPFFTTKFTGHGLGLSAVIGIVRAHGGTLRVYSEVNKGTTFKVLFPAVDAPRTVPSKSGANGAWYGDGTVLLVDDEETVRVTSRRMLQRLGFEVLLAEDGKEAVELYRQRGGDIVLVLLDLTMPRMDGEEAFRELRAIDPQVKVILASGYTEADVAARFAGKGLAGCLHKPYSLSRLRELLPDLLPARGGCQNTEK